MEYALYFVKVPVLSRFYPYFELARERPLGEFSQVLGTAEADLCDGTHYQSAHV